jgi:hypothetical protein
MFMSLPSVILSILHKPLEVAFSSWMTLLVG